MTTTRISICIPAHNAAQYLPEALASVRAQTFADWELIVAEDGTRDATERIVNAFAGTVPQPVRYTRQDPNQGPSAARNTAIGLARADWIALLDSDDHWTPEHLASCWEAAERTGADLVDSGAILFDDETGRETGLRAPTPALLAALPVSLFDGRYTIQPSAVLLRRELWRRTGGFDPEFRYAEDRELWLRCLRRGARIEGSGDNTCRYRKHAAGFSTHSARMAEAEARILDRHLDWEEIPAALRRTHCARAWAAAGSLSWRSDPALARAHFRRACAVHWHLRWWAHGLLCAATALRRPATPSAATA